MFSFTYINTVLILNPFNISIKSSMLFLTEEQSFSFVRVFYTETKKIYSNEKDYLNYHKTNISMDLFSLCLILLQMNLSGSVINTHVVISE